EETADGRESLRRCWGTCARSPTAGARTSDSPKLPRRAGQILQTSRDASACKWCAGKFLRPESRPPRANDDLRIRSALLPHRHRQDVLPAPAPDNRGCPARSSLSAATHAKDLVFSFIGQRQDGHDSLQDYRGEVAFFKSNPASPVNPV